MTTVNAKATFHKDIKEVWNLVTSLQNQKWRSDISHIEVIDKSNFIEYTKDNYSTNFTITALETYKRYEFIMENTNMKGRWIGLFHFENGITSIDFTEHVEAKKFFMKPFVKSYLKKQQASYIADLNKALQ